MSDLGKRVRQIALIVMIAGLGVANLFLYLRGQIVWGIFWSLILLLVAGFELYSFYVSKAKTTISNVWKKWSQESPFWAYTTLALLCIGLNALIVHLAVW